MARWGYWEERILRLHFVSLRMTWDFWWCGGGIGVSMPSQSRLCRAMVLNGMLAPDKHDIRRFAALCNTPRGRAKGVRHVSIFRVILSGGFYGVCPDFPRHSERSIEDAESKNPLLLMARLMARRGYWEDGSFGSTSFRSG